MRYSVELFEEDKFICRASFGNDLEAAYKYFQRATAPIGSNLRLIGRHEQIILRKESNEDLQDNQTY